MTRLFTTLYLISLLNIVLFGQNEHISVYAGEIHCKAQKSIQVKIPIHKSSRSPLLLHPADQSIKLFEPISPNLDATRSLTFIKKISDTCTIGYTEETWELIWFKDDNISDTTFITIEVDLTENLTGIEQLIEDSILLVENTSTLITIPILNGTNHPIIMTEPPSSFLPDYLQLHSVFPRRILAGEVDSIQLEINANELYGAFATNLYFKTNEKISHPYFKLTLKGRVLGMNKPIIQFDNTHIHKDIVAAKKTAFNFWLTNTGNTPLKINKVLSTCSCLSTTYSSDPILPGERRQIVANYKIDRVGSYEKSFSVYHNGTSDPTILTISGVIYSE